MSANRFRFRPMLEEIEVRYTPATTADPMSMSMMTQPTGGAMMTQSAPAQPGGTTTEETAPTPTQNSGTPNNSTTGSTNTGAGTNSTMSGSTLTASSGSGPSGSTSTNGGLLGSSAGTFNYIGVNTFPLFGVSTGLYAIDSTGPVGSLSLAQSSPTGTATSQNGSYPATTNPAGGLPVAAVGGRGSVQGAAEQLNASTSISGSLFGPLSSGSSSSQVSSSPAAASSS